MKRLFIFPVLFLCLFAAAPLAHAAIAQDAVTNITVSGAGVASYTFTHTDGTLTNGLLLVFAECDNGDFLSGVTYNSVAATQLIKIATPAGSGEIYIYGLLAPANGANSVVISRGATSCGTITGSSVSFTGVQQSGLPDATGSGSQSTGTTLTTSITTVADNSWIVGYTQFNNQAITAGTNSTVINTGPNAGGPWSMFKYTSNPKTPAGAQSLSMNGGAGISSMLLVSFAPFIPPTPAPAGASFTLNGAKMIIMGSQMVIY